MLRLMDEKFAAAEDEGNADGPLPDVPDQAVQEVHGQNICTFWKIFMHFMYFVPIS